VASARTWTSLMSCSLKSRSGLTTACITSVSCVAAATCLEAYGCGQPTSTDPRDRQNSLKVYNACRSHDAPAQTESQQSASPHLRVFARLALQRKSNTVVIPVTAPPKDMPTRVPTQNTNRLRSASSIERHARTERSLPIQGAALHHCVCQCTFRLSIWSLARGLPRVLRDQFRPSTCDSHRTVRIEGRKAQDVTSLAFPSRWQASKEHCFQPIGYHFILELG
jgi:hypothetical protein